MDENLILKLSPYTLKRFEQNLGEDGIMFLYNINTNEPWTGNYSSYCLIKLINGQKTLSEIYKGLLPLFEGYEYDEIKQSFDSLLEDLIDRKFLEIGTIK